MARTASTASSKLTTKTARLKLKPRRKPYFTSLAPKLLLGYLRREGSARAGAWVKQTETGRNESGQPIRQVKQLGAADDYAPADGASILTYEQARTMALTDPAKAAPVPALTVKQAISAYIENLSAEKGEQAAADARYRLEGKKTARIPVELAGTKVADLTLSQLRAWRNSLVSRDEKDPDAERRSKDTANRILSQLKAALNFVYADEAHGILSDKSWGRALKGFKDVGKAREHHFSEAEALTLIDKAREQNPCFANLLEAAFHTGARYGELVRLDVKHFNAKGNALFIPDGKTGSRTTILTQEGVAFFKTLVEGKKPGDVLIPYTKDGRRWGKSWQQRPMKTALKAAELPADACFYTLRHTYASRAIERGIPLTLLAANMGTSLRMLEVNYAKSLAQTRRDLVEKTAPVLRPALRVVR